MYYDLGRLYFIGKLNLFFYYLTREILEQLFNLIFYLILTPTLTLTPQLSPNSNRKPHIKCAHEYSAMLFFSL